MCHPFYMYHSVLTLPARLLKAASLERALEREVGGKALLSRSAETRAVIYCRDSRRETHS